MTDTTRLLPDARHPGAFITANYLAPLGISVRAFANALGMAASSAIQLLSGEARVTPDLAVRLETVLHRKAESWLAMQDAYDLGKARATANADGLQRLVACGCEPGVCHGDE